MSTMGVNPRVVSIHVGGGGGGGPFIEQYRIPPDE